MLLEGNVFSGTLELNTGIAVVSPNHLNVGGNYKVAYLLHGLGGNNRDWIDFTMLPVYANEYDTIFVMPEVG